MRGFQRGMAHTSNAPSSRKTTASSTRRARRTDQQRAVERASRAAAPGFRCPACARRAASPGIRPGRAPVAPMSTSCCASRCGVDFAFEHVDRRHEARGDARREVDARSAVAFGRHERRSPARCRLPRSPTRRGAATARDTPRAAISMANAGTSVPSMLAASGTRRMTPPPASTEIRPRPPPHDSSSSMLGSTPAKRCTARHDDRPRSSPDPLDPCTMNGARAAACRSARTFRRRRAPQALRASARASARHWTAATRARDQRVRPAPACASSRSGDSGSGSGMRMSSADRRRPMPTRWRRPAARACARPRPVADRRQAFSSMATTVARHRLDSSRRRRSDRRRTPSTAESRVPGGREPDQRRRCAPSTATPARRIRPVRARAGFRDGRHGHNAISIPS